MFANKRILVPWVRRLTNRLLLLLTGRYEAQEFSVNTHPQIITTHDWVTWSPKVQCRHEAQEFSFNNTIQYNIIQYNFIHPLRKLQRLLKYIPWSTNIHRSSPLLTRRHEAQEFTFNTHPQISITADWLGDMKPKGSLSTLTCRSASRGTTDPQYSSTRRISWCFSALTGTTMPQSAKYWKSKSRRSFLRRNSSTADSEYSTMAFFASETHRENDYITVFFCVPP